MREEGGDHRNPVAARYRVRFPQIASFDPWRGRFREPFRIRNLPVAIVLPRPSPLRRPVTQQIAIADRAHNGDGARVWRRRNDIDAMKRNPLRHRSNYPVAAAQFYWR